MMDWRAWAQAMFAGGGRKTPTKHADVFALRFSGLEAFLYADVGTELNGSTLTVLSAVARLGNDPWAQAAQWAALPQSVATDQLADNIAQMPLVPDALAAVRDTAARLIRLLPAKTELPSQNGDARSTGSKRQRPPETILYCVLAVGMALNVLALTRHAPNETLGVAIANDIGSKLTPRITE